MKRLFCLLAALIIPLCLLLSSCGARQKVYYTTCYDCFDTVCSLYAAADNEQDFQKYSDAFREELSRLNELFDAYGERSVVNIKTVNDNAGKAELQVDKDLYGLLRFSLDFEKTSGGVVNPVMGAVTKLWKEAVSEGVPPDAEALSEAAKHTDVSSLILDDETLTVRLSDPDARIDVGATAKGYAARLIAEILERAGCENYVLSLGGNVSARGTDPRTGKAWQAGIRDPGNGDASVRTLLLGYASLVTSGSYERYLDCNGVRYHHIIDPATAYPAARSDVVSVSILHTDPALADALSTALFILQKPEGEALLKKTGGEALFINAAGEVSATAQFPEDRDKTVLRGDAAVLILAAILLTTAVIVFLAHKKTPDAPAEKKTAETQETAEPAESREKNAEDKKPTFPRFGKKDFIFFAALAVTALLLPFLLFGFGGDGEHYRVKICQGGKELCSLPLDEDAEYRVQNEKGYNVIVIKDGRASVVDADCDGRDCVHIGAIDKDSVIPVIACLPHELTVRIERNE